MMTVSAEALRVMAECISRSERLTLESLGGETGVWCRHCEAHTAQTITLRGITSEAVYDCGTVTACPMCIEEPDA